LAAEGLAAFCQEAFSRDAKNSNEVNMFCLDGWHTRIPSLNRLIGDSAANPFRNIGRCSIAP
jgi:hypothetical protein